MSIPPISSQAWLFQSGTVPQNTSRENIPTEQSALHLEEQRESGNTFAHQTPSSPVSMEEVDRHTFERIVPDRDLQQLSFSTSLYPILYSPEQPSAPPLEEENEKVEYNLAVLESSAESRDAEAQYNLALQKRSKDPEASFDLCLKAAKQQHIKAQLCLVQFYSHGEGVEFSWKSAIDWGKQVVEMEPQYAFWIRNKLFEAISKKDTENLSPKESTKNIPKEYLADILSLMEKGPKENKKSESYKEYWEISKQIFPDISEVEIARNWSKIAYTWRMQKHSKNEMDCYNYSFDLYESILKRNQTPSLGKEILDMGNFWKNDPQKALKFYELGLIIYSDQFQIERSFVFRKLGNVWFKLVNFEKSLSFYHKSLKLLEQILENKPHRDIAKILHEMALAYSFSNETKKSKKFFEKTIAMYRELNDFDSVFPILEEFIFTLGEKGDYNKILELFIKFSEDNYLYSEYKPNFFDEILDILMDANKFIQIPFALKKPLFNAVHRICCEPGKSKEYFLLGYLYFYGIGTKKSVKLARDCFKSASEGKLSAKCIDTLNCINAMPKRGEIRTKRKELVFELLQLLAEVGYAEAQHLLGEVYYHGLYVIKNFEQAKKWFEKSSIVKPCGYELFYHFFNGDGCKKDREEGILRLTSAALDGKKIAQNLLEKDNINYHLEEIKNTQQMLKSASDCRNFARIFEVCATMKKNPIAMSNCGVLHYHGLGCKQDYSLAVENFKNAAVLGDSEAQYRLGACYNEGKTSSFVGPKMAKLGIGALFINDQSAFIWWKKASEQGHLEATYNLAICYIKQHGIKRDLEEAYRLLKFLSTKECFGKLGARILYNLYCLSSFLSNELDFQDDITIETIEALDPSLKVSIDKLKRASLSESNLTDHLQGYWHSNPMLRVEYDPEAPVVLMKRALEGQASSMVHLGKFHKRKQEFEIAYHYFLAAELNGDPDGKYHRAHMIYSEKDQDRRVIASNLWLEAAKKGHGLSYYEYGKALYRRDVPTSDSKVNAKKEAKHWFWQNVYESFFPLKEAAYNLGCIEYFQGNYDMSIRSFEEALNIARPGKFIRKIHFAIAACKFKQNKEKKGLHHLFLSGMFKKYHERTSDLFLSEADLILNPHEIEEEFSF